MDAYTKDVRFYDGSTGTHTTVIDTRFGNWCTCLGFLSGHCKHIEEAALEMPIKFDRDIKTYQSSVGALNQLFGGNTYKSDQIFMFYAPPATGKSLMLAQEACWFASKGMNVLYIDTEGSSTTFLKKWGQVFEERFGELKGNIVVHPTADLKDLIRFLGRTCDVAWVQSTAAKKKKAKEKAEAQGAEVEEETVSTAGGKQEFRSMEEIANPEIINKIKEYEIDVIIVDSITEPLATTFGTGNQNFPARSDAVGCIFGLLTKIQVKYNMLIITTAHASTNPTNPYEIREALKGGRTQKYFAKNLVYIDKREQKDAANYRRLWLVRGEDSAEWSRAAVSMITDVGYIDVDQEAVKEIAFTQNELGRMDAYMKDH